MPLVIRSLTLKAAAHERSFTDIPLIDDWYTYDLAAQTMLQLCMESRCLLPFLCNQRRERGCNSLYSTLSGAILYSFSP
jgi:hypothetical protein